MTRAEEWINSKYTRKRSEHLNNFGSGFTYIYFFHKVFFCNIFWYDCYQKKVISPFWSFPLSTWIITNQNASFTLYRKPNNGSFLLNVGIKTTNLFYHVFNCSEKKNNSFVWFFFLVLPMHKYTHLLQSSYKRFN